jgi:hypothetical protein
MGASHPNHNLPMGEEDTVKTAIRISALAAALGAMAVVSHAQNNPNHFTRTSPAVETYIVGGPWTLEQSGAAVGLKSAGYCDANGNQVPNPGAERMQPYYFPFITGHGRHLQGYFDYRPKDTNEAVVAANSDDGGKTWNFQQEVLQLRTTCPTQANKEPDGEKDGFNGNNADNGDDDGQGHQFILNIAGHTYLYTLDRAVGHIDFDDLYIHELSPQPGLPLNGAPAMDDGPTDETTNLPEIPFHTTGLMDPDGILGVVPGTWPLKIIYEQKILSGDLVFPAAQQCNTAWATYYNTNPFGTGVNDDVTHLRLAETTDGIHFKDDGILQGLNDPTDVTAFGTRWLATAGTILKLEGGKYGLLFSGGGCIDGDSDAFRYIGYAESRDLINWKVINGLNNPVLITTPYTITVDTNGLPASTGTSITVPSTPAIGGITNGFYAGRVYAPSATPNGEHDLTVFFAGYHTPKPKNGLGDYRTISRIALHSDQAILATSTNLSGPSGDEEGDN